MQTYLADIRAVYGAPDSDDPQRAFAILAEELANFPDHLSKAARAELFDLMKGRANKFPPAHLIKQAARQAAQKSEGVAPDPARTAELLDSDPWSEKAKATANKLLNSDTGRKAALEGWIGQLYSFCRVNRRLPIAGEQHKLIERARLFDEAYAKLCRDLEEEMSKPPERPKALGSWAPVSGSNGNLLATCKRGMEHFLSERDRLAAIANGEQQQ